MPRRGRADPPDGEDLGLIGRSEGIQELRRLIRLVAPTEATVLVRGERGTGKELVASAIQRLSRRKDRPYLKLNCAALPRELLASELFGHERGAFTGALQRRPGLLAAAHGGTLFLDEIGDLSLEGQAMLLRFLEEREVRPLGSIRTFQVDVRLVAATNKDIEAAIQQNEFRADLYDRVSEVVLEVPPLRERREDVPLLAEHFLACQSRRHGVKGPVLTEGMLRCVEREDWPGNVRELEKAVSRAVIFATAGRIPVSQLGLARDENVRPRSAPSIDRLGDSASCGLVLTQRQREVLDIASLRGSVRRGDLTSRFGGSCETARRELVALVRLGLLARSGAGRGTRYVLA
jgi:transcriptional regulator with GAF, ATPase, and Fis domain